MGKRCFFLNGRVRCENLCHVYLNGRARREILAYLLKRTGYKFQVVRLTTLYCSKKTHTGHFKQNFKIHKILSVMLIF
jgi:hypothetical protein